MAEEKLNLRFDIPLGQIEDMICLRINGDFSGYDRVISPRDLRQVKGMTFFRKDIFDALMRKIPLRGTMTLPYESSRIQVYGREPKGMDIGQTFVLKSKLISIMEGLERGVFQEFVVKGISKMPPALLYGLDSEGRKALAFYVPPIIEMHGQRAILIDGIHRSRLCSGAGTTINAVHISSVGSPLPFEPITWDDVRMMDEKPPVAERYKDLRKEYFRDLSALGIDG